MRRLAAIALALLLALAVQSEAKAQAPARMEATDPHNFGGWLNATRARYGLPAVAYDANLTAWAQQNNIAQQARGLGHWVMGPARRQNSAMSAYFNVVPGMWFASAGHRAALLDPSITRYGLAGFGPWWTFSAQ